jgi:hypothetical protein
MIGIPNMWVLPQMEPLGAGGVLPNALFVEVLGITKLSIVAPPPAFIAVLKSIVDLSVFVLFSPKIVNAKKAAKIWSARGLTHPKRLGTVPARFQRNTRSQSNHKMRYKHGNKNWH